MDIGEVVRVWLVGLLHLVLLEGAENGRCVFFLFHFLFNDFFFSFFYKNTLLFSVFLNVLFSFF